MIRGSLAIALCITPAAAFARAGLPSNNPTLNPANSNCPAYVGVGDLDPGALFYYGLRAYSQAKARALVNAFQVIRASDFATADIPVLCDGALNTTVATAFCASTTCNVTIIYDQTGNGYDALVRSSAFYGVLQLNCSLLAGKPCFYGNNVAFYFSTLDAHLMTQPDSYWAVSQALTNAGHVAVTIGCGFPAGAIGSQRITAFAGGAHSGYAGTDVTNSTGVSVTDHLFVANGASSIYDTNNNLNSGAGGANNCALTDFIEPFDDGGAGMTFVEAAGYTTAKTNTDYATLRTNAQAFWGY